MPRKHNKPRARPSRRWFAQPAVLGPVLAAFVTGVFALLVVLVSHPRSPEKAPKGALTGGPDSVEVPQPPVATRQDRGDSTTAATVPPGTRSQGSSPASGKPTGAIRPTGSTGSSTAQESSEGDAGSRSANAESAHTGRPATEYPDEIRRATQMLGLHDVLIRNSSNRGLYFYLRPEHGSWTAFYLPSEYYQQFHNADEIRVETSPMQSVQYALRQRAAYVLGWDERRGRWDVFLDHD
jgi:hypothetical protein